MKNEVPSMSQIEVSYEETIPKIIDEIKKHERAYIATSVNDNVTVRQMMLNSKDLKLWFLTDVNTRKVKQIQTNPKVAIAIGNYLQIEGKATVKSHPSDKENFDFIQAFKEKDPEIYERSLRPGRTLARETSIVIEVVPKRIALTVWTPEWDKESKGPSMYILNTDNEKAFQVFFRDFKGYTAEAYTE